MFAGIGGCAAGLGPRARVVAAVDQNRGALEVYRHNFPAHHAVPKAVQSLADADWRGWDADLWWMSPPCPPFTRRGLQRDLDDPRAASFRTLVGRIDEHRPRYVAFENVPGFVDSRAHALLLATLDGAGYARRETLLCPTELGLPNRRARFYLVAGRDTLADWPERRGPSVALADVLDPQPAPELWCDDGLARRYDGALNIVDATSEAAVTACFTSAYGRSPVRSGSYLRTPAGLRRFSPAEILRLLDFPREYSLPPGLPRDVAWRLVGNSLSVRAVRWILTAIPALAT